MERWRIYHPGQCPELCWAHRACSDGLEMLQKALLVPLLHLEALGPCFPHLMQVRGTRGASNSVSCLALGPTAIRMAVIISKREILARKRKICADNSLLQQPCEKSYRLRAHHRQKKWDGSRGKVGMDNSKHEWIRPRSIQNTHPEVHSSSGARHSS